MKIPIFLICLVTLSVAFADPTHRNAKLRRKSWANWDGWVHSSDFPKGFMFGTATGSYLIEGAWNEDGKGEDIWDRAAHTLPNYWNNNSTACDSYHRYKEDIKLIKDTGFPFYRMSISWARILPRGTSDYINPKGLNYYRNVFNELAKNRIEPMVTLYHWDLPQSLQDIGGWMNETIVDHFTNYARIIFKNFGHQVKWWLTINEPFSMVRGYSTKDFPPNYGLTGVGDYIAAHNVLKAHAKVYRMYHREFGQKQKGKVSFVFDGPFVIPRTNSPEDAKAAEQAMQFKFGLFTHPVYSKTGDYPPIVRELVDKHSWQEGRKTSRLPYFTKQEIEEIRGSYDFLGYNHYTTLQASFGSFGENPSFERDSSVKYYADPNWPVSFRIPSCWWLLVYPEGIRGVVNWIRKEYGDQIPIVITENGYCDDGRLDDWGRVKYFDDYLRNLLKAIKEDGANVIGYMAWSILDNYGSSFGLYQVDFNDPKLPRRKKKSAEYWEYFLRP